MMSSLFLKILNMSISAGWLVLAVVILRFALKKAPRWVSVLLWGIVAVRLICPVSLESALSLIPSAQTIPVGIEMEAAPAIDSGIPVINNAVNPIISQFLAPDPSASANPLQILIPVAAGLWLLGVAAMLIYTAVSYWHLRRRIGTAVLLKDNIFQSEYVDSPFVLGMIQPRIYLPFQMNPQDLAHVVAHEQAHIQRKDHWWKPLGFLLLAVHWFNPLMWLAYILLCRDIELACDEKVIEKLDSEHKADYTQALVACSVRRRMIAACPLAFGEVGVKERVKSVMKYQKPAFWIVIAALVICAVVVVCFLTNPLQDKFLQDDANDFISPGFSSFTGNILEIHKDYFLVKPSAGTQERGRAEAFIVPIQNIPSSPEPVVGDLIHVEYDFDTSGIVEDGKVTLPSVSRIQVIRIPNLPNKPLMVLVRGTVYVDTGIESTKEHPSGTPSARIDAILPSGSSPIVRQYELFGGGYFYHAGSDSSTIDVCIDGTYRVFATEDVYKLLVESKGDQYADILRDAPDFLATILEIHEGYFLVEPHEDSPERLSADQIVVPIKNMPLSPEPVVGDLIHISYNGEILETYPAQLREVYRVHVIRIPEINLPRMVNVDGEVYQDTGIESSRTDHSGILLFDIDSTVGEEQIPHLHRQSNFGIGYTYHAGEKEGVIEVNIDGTWYLFAINGLIEFPAEPC